MRQDRDSMSKANSNLPGNMRQVKEGLLAKWVKQVPIGGNIGSAGIISTFGTSLLWVLT